MRILVTGGAGFLGSNLTEDLLKEGHDVTVVDNLSTGSMENIDDLKDQSNFTFYKMGIETDAFLDEFDRGTSKKFDQVFHLACPTGVPNIEFLGEEMVEACSTGTKNVLHVAREDDAKLVFTSSSEVYGDPQVVPQAETYTGEVDPQGPRANYEEGKRFSETLVKLYVTKYGLEASTLRLFNVYGPKMNRSDTRVVPRFVQQALRNEPLTVHDGGKQRRTMCYASDLVAGLKTVMEKGASGEVYNIGSDEELTMWRLAEIIVELTNSKSELTSVPGFAHDHKSRMPNLERISALGWSRSVNLESGLGNTVEYFKRFLKSA
jgi:nucleoside-diphosphate-sugar epimerase